MRRVIDKKLQKQIEKQISILHENWIQAIKETHGIGPTLLKRIIEKREEIAKQTIQR